MMRLLVTTAFAVGLVALGCGGGATRNRSTGMEETGGGGGDGTGGSGTGGKATGGSDGKTGGTGGSATGGAVGTGGMMSSTGGAGGSVAPDAATALDAPGPDAMSVMSGDGGAAGLGGEPFPGKPWIYLCPKAWNQTQCCDLLCRCLPALCSDSPQDASRFGMCMSMCSKLTDMRARCQVYHCFESKNPGAVQDHASHCGHASGRVGGGSCTILGQQQ
jgi:hypothetical protein